MVFRQLQPPPTQGQTQAQTVTSSTTQTPAPTQSSTQSQIVTQSTSTTTQSQQVTSQPTSSQTQASTQVQTVTSTITFTTAPTQASTQSQTVTQSTPTTTQNQEETQQQTSTQAQVSTQAQTVTNAISQTPAPIQSSESTTSQTITQSIPSPTSNQVVTQQSTQSQAQASTLAQTTSSTPTPTQSSTNSQSQTVTQATPAAASNQEGTSPPISTQTQSLTQASNPTQVQSSTQTTEITASQQTSTQQVTGTPAPTSASGTQQSTNTQAQITPSPTNTQTQQQSQQQQQQTQQPAQTTQQQQIEKTCSEYYDTNPNPNNTKWEGQYCKTCSNKQRYRRLLLKDQIVCAEYSPDTKSCIYKGMQYSSASYGTKDKTDYCFRCVNCSQTQDDLGGGKDLKDLFDLSLGCTECRPNFEKTLSYYQYGPFFLRSCTQNQAPVGQLFVQQGWYQYIKNESINNGLSLADCSTTYSNCVGCDKSTCKVCKADFYLGTQKDTQLQDSQVCLYKKCGLKGKGPDFSLGTTICQTCTLSNCKACQFQVATTSTNATISIETCTICNVGYYLQTNTATGISTCIAQSSSSVTKDFYILPYSGLELTFAQNPTQFMAFYQNDGLTVATPFLFIQQALYRINQEAFKYKGDYNVNIQLMYGEHFFFYCYLASQSNNMITLQFCDNQQMVPSYPKSDNVKLSIKALTCQKLSADGYSTSKYPQYRQYCIFDNGFDNKPIVYINSNNFYFNISNYAYFENIIFDGQNQYGSLSVSGTITQSLPNGQTNQVTITNQTIDENIRLGFPYKACSISEDNSRSNKRITLLEMSTSMTIGTLQATISCKNLDQDQLTAQPMSSTDTCDPTQQSILKSQARCSGEPYSSDFFTQDAQDDKGTFILLNRRKVLFNIYSFDRVNSNRQHTPTLIINKCEFRYFVRNYQALIYVENNNFYSEDNGADHLFLGEDNGLSLTITSSIFRNSRFCKGMIVYRKSPFIYDKMLYNYTHESITKYEAIQTDSKIFISDSQFTELNWLSSTTAVALYDSEEKYNQKLVQNDRIFVPQFYHFGIILNVGDFSGPIQFSGNTINKNTIYIPEIYIPPHSIGRVADLTTFLSNNPSQYMFKKCDDSTGKSRFLFDEGFDFNTNLDSMFTQFERLAVIYIQRHKGIVIFKNNRFISNIGLYGGAITIDTPDNTNMSTYANATQISSYLIVQDNYFEQNMGYISGNAIYARFIKRTDQITKQCGGIYIQNNQFYQNFGFKKHNGGAFSIVCEHLQNDKYIDFYHTSSLSYNLSTNLTITDYINSSITYTFNPNQTLIANNIFLENFSGFKGLAVYLKYLSSIYLFDNQFINNGAVYGYQEIYYSPYYSILANKKRFISYSEDSGACFDELDYIEDCAKTGYTIDFSIPQVNIFQFKNIEFQGVVYIEHCSDIVCQSVNVNQTSNLTKNLFQTNDIGPYLNEDYSFQRAASIYIKNGYQVSIPHSQNSVYGELNDMPSDYFLYTQAPLILIDVSAVRGTSESSTLYFNAIISNSSFYNNFHYQILGLNGVTNQYSGSLIQYTSSMTSNNKIIAQLSLVNNTIRDNVAKGTGLSLISIQNAFLTATRNNFTNNGYLSDKILQKTASLVNTTNYGDFPYQDYKFTEAQQYGVFLIKVSNMIPSDRYFQFQHNSFRYIFSTRGGAYTFIASQTLTSIFFNNTYDNLISDQAPVLESQISSESLTLAPYFNLTNERISNVYASSYGAIKINQNTNQHAIYMKNITFTNCWGSHGSAISNINGGVIVCRECNFTKITNVTTQYGYTYFLNSKNQLIQNITYNKTLVQDFLGSDSLYSKFIDCSFTNLRATYGSALYMDSSYVIIQNTKRDDRGIYQISNNIATYGTIAAYLSSVLKLQNIRLENNQALQGSALNIQQSSTAIVNQTLINNNTVTEKGTIYLINLSNLTMMHTLVNNNSAVEDSSFLFSLYNDQPGLINVTNSIIRENRAGANTINLIYSQANISNTQILDNIAIRVNHGITLISSIISLKNITVNYTNPEFIKIGDLIVDTGFLNLNFQSTLYLSNSVIINCRGKISAVLQATGSSKIYISDNTRIMKAFSTSGNIFQFQSTQEVIFRNTFFSENQQENIYLESAVLQIYDSTFEKSAETFINVKNGDLILQGVTMKNSVNRDLPGIGLYCNCHNLQILNSTFTNLSSSYGGAIYLQSFPNSNFTIQNSTFHNNTARRGGAIYIEQSQNITLLGNNFTFNKAMQIQESSSSLESIIGGAIFYQCLVSSGLSCKVYINRKNLFKNNTASNQGGALAYTNVKFIMDQSNILENNSAPYGGDMSSYPNYLSFQMITNNDYLNSSDYAAFRRNLQFQQRTLASNTTLTDQKLVVVSGRGFSFQITLYDQEGNQMLEENSASAAIKINNTRGVQSIVLSNNEAQAQKGKFSFNNVLLIAPPGSNIGIQLSITNLQTYGNTINFIEKPLVADIQTRLCASGEEYTSDYRCLLCPPEFYLYDPPRNVTSCKDCSANAKCYAGSVVAPRFGYWRSSNISESFVKCPRMDSCLAGNDKYPTGVCSQGYKGVVCGTCISGFSKVSNFECSKCPSKTDNVIKLSFILLGAILVVIFLVRSTLQSADKQKPVYSVYLKIIANHFQIIGSLSTIDFNWPSEIQQLQDQQSQVSGVSEQIFSIDCFLMGDDQKQSQDAQIYYLKLIFFAFLPLILSLFSTFYWLLHSVCKRNFSELKNSLISTIVIILFLVHPNIAKMMFSSFNCMDIDGELRLMPELSQKCFEGKHSVYLIAVSIPSVIVWAMGIPFFALILLLKNKRIILQIESQQIQSKADKWTIKRIKAQLGFLFNGYKIKTFYWEIVILYRKIMIVMVTVFLSSVSPETQVLVGLIIIIISILLQVKLRPYYTSTLNKMESYSLMVSAVTLYSGMFYITGRNYKYMNNDGVKWFFLLCIAMPNVIFLGYWIYNMIIELLKLMIINNQFKVFRIITCGRIKIDRFQRKHMKKVKSAFDDNEEEDESEQNNGSSKTDPGLKYIINDKDPLEDEDRKTPRNLLGEYDISSKRNDSIANYNEMNTKVRMLGSKNEQSARNMDDFSAIGRIETPSEFNSNREKQALQQRKKNRFKGEEEDHQNNDLSLQLNDIKLDMRSKNQTGIFSNEESFSSEQNQMNKKHQNKSIMNNNIPFENSFGLITMPKLNLKNGMNQNFTNEHHQPQSQKRQPEQSQRTHRKDVSPLLSFRSNHKVFPLDNLYQVKNSLATHRVDSSAIQEEERRRITLKSVKFKPSKIPSPDPFTINNVDKEKKSSPNIQIFEVEEPLEITKPIINNAAKTDRSNDKIKQRKKQRNRKKKGSKFDYNQDIYPFKDDQHIQPLTEQEIMEQYKRDQEQRFQTDRYKTSIQGRRENGPLSNDEVSPQIQNTTYQYETDNDSIDATTRKLTQNLESNFKYERKANNNINSNPKFKLNLQDPDWDDEVKSNKQISNDNYLKSQEQAIQLQNNVFITPFNDEVKFSQDLQNFQQDKQLYKKNIFGKSSGLRKSQLQQNKNDLSILSINQDNPVSSEFMKMHRLINVNNLFNESEKNHQQDISEELSYQEEIKIQKKSNNLEFYPEQKLQTGKLKQALDEAIDIKSHQKSKRDEIQKRNKSVAQQRYFGENDYQYDQLNIESQNNSLSIQNVQNQAFENSLKVYPKNKEQSNSNKKTRSKNNQLQTQDIHHRSNPFL